MRPTLGLPTTGHPSPGLAECCQEDPEAATATEHPWPDPSTNAAGSCLCASSCSQMCRGEGSFQPLPRISRATGARHRSRRGGSTCLHMLAQGCQDLPDFENLQKSTFLCDHF